VYGLSDEDVLVMEADGSVKDDDPLGSSIFKTDKGLSCKKIPLWLPWEKSPSSDFACRPRREQRISVPPGAVMCMHTASSSVALTQTQRLLRSS
jgi:hypothetical protein